MTEEQRTAVQNQGAAQGTAWALWTVLLSVTVFLVMHLAGASPAVAMATAASVGTFFFGMYCCIFSVLVFCLLTILFIDALIRGA